MRPIRRQHGEDAAAQLGIGARTHGDSLIALVI